MNRREFLSLAVASIVAPSIEGPTLWNVALATRRANEKLIIGQHDLYIMIAARREAYMKFLAEKIEQTAWHTAL